LDETIAFHPRFLFSICHKHFEREKKKYKIKFPIPRNAIKKNSKRHAAHKNQRREKASLSCGRKLLHPQPL
jgi:hypothetical protein